jgi:hypothetical protein
MVATSVCAPEAVVQEGVTNDEVARELFEIAEWFDRMAHHVERRLERHYVQGKPPISK